jgi:two-component system LytT family response regulator
MPTNQALRAVVVDDDESSRHGLVYLLASHTQVKVVGEAADLTHARHLIEATKPHAVFLDVHLKPENGFDLIPHLPSGTSVVLVTAHERYALQAFAANAVDYLQKPVQLSRLGVSIARLVARHIQASALLNIGTNAARNAVDSYSVIAIVAQGDYSRVLMEGRNCYLVHRTMREWVKLLPSYEFAVLTRSLIVNKRRITGLKVKSRDAAELLLGQRADPLPLGRQGIARVRKLLAGSSLLESAPDPV